MALTEYVIMPGADYQAACDAIRTKTGKTSTIASGDMATQINSISTTPASARVTITNNTSNPVMVQKSCYNSTSISVSQVTSGNTSTITYKIGDTFLIYPSNTTGGSIPTRTVTGAVKRDTNIANLSNAWSTMVRITDTTATITID